MKKLGITATAIILLLAAALAFAQMSGKGKATGKNNWSFNAKIIEACSCRLMCPCYFNASPDSTFASSITPSMSYPVITAAPTWPALKCGSPAI